MGRTADRLLGTQSSTSPSGGGRTAQRLLQEQQAANPPSQVSGGGFWNAGLTPGLGREKAIEIANTPGSGLMPGLDKGISQTRNVIQAANTPFTAGFKATGLPWAAEKLGQGVGEASEVLAGADAKILKTMLPKNIENKISGVVNAAADPNSKINRGIQKYTDSFTSAEKNALGLVKDTAELAGNAVGVKQVVGGIPKVTDQVSSALTARRVANLTRDTKAMDNLVGTIVQGTTKDVATAKSALSTVDTTGVKSYSDLKHVVQEKLDNINTKLDEALATNKETKKLADLNLKTKVGDSTVSHNYVQDSITQLKEHYKATNNVKGLAEIEQLEVLANTKGLTVQEINNLARRHGSDLNAFNANGQAASGLTKQAAENTRTGLKSTARDMFDDPVYKAADAETTKLIRTKELVGKMEEAVNKLSQKIKARTWGEVVGNTAAKVVNILGLNSPKGFVEFFLGRGTGLKTLNALDLNVMLEKNLNKLQEVFKSGASPATIESKLQEIIDSANQGRSSQVLNLASNPGKTLDVNQSKPVVAQIPTKIRNSVNMGSRDNLPATNPKVKGAIPETSRGQKAVSLLLERKGGEVKGAFHNKELGDIDLVWGQPGDKGHGLAHIQEQRPGLVENLDKIISEGKVVFRSDNRAFIETPDHKAVIGLKWFEEPKKWMLTTYEKLPK